jgi:hypothetical protein
MDIEKEIKHQAIVLIATFIIAIFGFTLLQASTTMHEGYHTIILRLIGCKPRPGAQLMIGATSWEEQCKLTDLQWVIVSLAGPLGSFIVGFLLWRYGGENSFLRFLALFMMLISAIPSLFLPIPGSDIRVAVQHGFDIRVAWLLFFIVSGVSFHAIVDEVLDKEVLKDLI